MELAVGNFKRAEQLFAAAGTYCEQNLDPKGESCTGVRLRQVVALLQMGYREKALQYLPALLAQTSSNGSARRQHEALIVAYRLLAQNNRLTEVPALRLRLLAVAYSQVESAVPEYIRRWAILSHAESLLILGDPLKVKETLDKYADIFLANQKNNDSALTARFFALKSVAEQKLGGNDTALIYIQRAVTEQTQANGASHSVTQLIQAQEALLLWAAGQPQAALASLERVLPQLQQSLGAEAPTLRHLQAVRDTLFSTAGTARYTQAVFRYFL